jgi:hypothetical protein
LHLLQKRVERLEPGLPVLAELPGPQHGVPERLGAEAAAVLASHNAPADEAGPLEHADVLGGRGEGHPEGRGELGEGALSGGELPDDGAACGVRQGVEDAVEPGGGIQNHVV